MPPVWQCVAARMKRTPNPAQPGQKLHFLLLRGFVSLCEIKMENFFTQRHKAEKRIIRFGCADFSQFA
jgi:hypothetical protein